MHSLENQSCALFNSTVIVDIDLKIDESDRQIFIKLPNTITSGFTVVCKIVHKIASVWCKIALGGVGVSLP